MKAIAAILFVALPIFAESVKPPAPPPDDDVPLPALPEVEKAKTPIDQTKVVERPLVKSKVKEKILAIGGRELKVMADGFRILTTEEQRRGFQRENLVDCEPAVVSGGGMVVDVRAEKLHHTRDGKWPDDASPPEKNEEVLAVRCWTSTENGFHCSYILYTKDGSMARSLDKGDYVSFKGRLAGGAFSHSHARVVQPESSTTLKEGAIEIVLILVNPLVKRTK